MAAKALLTAVCLLGLTGVVWAKVEVLRFDNAEQEQRYLTLIKELRCLVCQNQNLADSNADLAKDLRQKTYEMIIAGSSDNEIVTYMVDRYGDFVMYRPPINSSTIVLWAGPFMILLIGLFVIIKVIRGRRQQPSGIVDQEQRKAAQRLLQENPPE